MFLNLAVIDDEGLSCDNDRSEDGDWDLNNNDKHSVDLVADGMQGGLNQQDGGVGRKQALSDEVGNVGILAVQGLDGLLVFRIEDRKIRSGQLEYMERLPSEYICTMWLLESIYTEVTLWSLSRQKLTV